MPEWSDAIRVRLAALELDAESESDIVEEFSQHLEARYEEFRRGGATDEEARRMAMDELNESELREANIRRAMGRGPVKAPAIGSRRGVFMAGMMHDLRVALRMIRTRPAFSALVVGMLALGIAGNAAIFSVFNAMFIRPLPFPGGERLVNLDETAPKWKLKFTGVSNPDYAAWQKDNSTFEAMAFFDTVGANLSTQDGIAQRVDGALVTRDLLKVLGLKPVLGREFLAEEDRPGGAKVVMIGYDVWRRLFGGDRQVIGKILKLNNEPYTVIGVLPKEAVLPEAGMWAPLQADTSRGGSYYLDGIGRLKAGVSIEQARADLQRIHTAAKNTVTSPTVMTVRERYVGEMKPVSRILLGAVGIVLLIACVNIAGLMMVRGASRAREIAIRVAVGASRARVVRQLLTESMVLAAAGAVVGVGLGYGALRWMITTLPQDVPKWVQVGLDARFVGFCVLVTAASALLFGLAPAWQSAGVDTRSGLQETARSSLSRSRRSALSVMVAFEIALALVLLVSSALLLQAFRKVLRVDPGFRTQDVLTFSISLPNASYSKPEQRMAFFRSYVDRLRALPGVKNVGAATHVPLGGHTGSFFAVEGGRTFGPNDQNPVVLDLLATPSYFDAIGARFVAGRAFNETDGSEKGVAAAIINESFKKLFWPDTDPIGKKLRYAFDKRPFEVVGMIRDTKHYGLDTEMRPNVFTPYQLRPRPNMTVVMSAGVEAASLTTAAREELRRLDSDLAMFNIRTMAERLDRSLWTRRAYSTLFAAFAFIAMVLAAAGIYGVVSYAVSQRTREIGIRMALGARPEQVMRGVLGGGMILVGAGIAVGLAGALAAAGLLEKLLFGVSGRDPVTYAGVIGGIVAVGLVANFVPARRAAGVEPIRALRME